MNLLPLNWLKALGFSNRSLLLAAARLNVGRNLAPGNEELGCVISVNKVVGDATGSSLCAGAGTTNAIISLSSTHSRWMEVPRDSAGAGDIIISVTGQGNGSVAHGHIGVLNGIATNPKSPIFSNNSYLGIWDTHLSVGAWDEYFLKRGGFAVRFFRAL